MGKQPEPDITDEAMHILRGAEEEHNTRQRRKPNKPEPPKILNCAELLQVESATEETLFGDGYPLPARGLILKVGAPKCGKTLLAVQEAVAIATGRALFDNYRVLEQGPVLIIEQDDPGGAASIKTIVERSGIASDTPLYVVPQLPFGFGPALLDWLDARITELSLVLVIIDSYTALRGARTAGGDFVKQEQFELTQLDALSKKRACAVELIHHASKGAAALDWTQTAAGSFAVAGAVEAQLHLSRFADLEGAAPERLVRIRGRHAEDAELVLRFQKETLNYQHVLDGAAAESYPAIKLIQSELGDTTFGPKELSQAIGISRATAHRLIVRLRYSDVLIKRGFGSYELSPGLRV